jgi:hypothetical protein
MMVNELEKVKKQYDIDSDFNIAIKSIKDVFTDLGKERFDVAGCIFEEERFMNAFFILEWDKKLRKFYEDSKGSNACLGIISMIYMQQAAKKGYADQSFIFVDLVKDIFGEDFVKLEKEALKTQKELMTSAMNQEGLMGNHYLMESKGSYYEKVIKQMVKEVNQEINK